ncbi:MAG TPA: YceD family protein [Steroidobacteraceae bacterium]|nr:YceD family protein [Steroidobacteraceae bacterium]
MRGPPWSQPLEVDRLAAGGADVDFAVPLAELSGLRSLRAGLGGSVQGRAHFGREQGVLVADLTFRGTVTVQCQRCLQPMERPIEGESHIALIGSEGVAAAVPLEREPVLAPGGRISVGELLTEELLLVLPIVPLHEDREHCVSERTDTGAAPVGETQRPFANLADLLKR